ncbi:MAG: pilus assembly protein N-terminal domain-containing protein [Myxococcota bacterium]|nr:pilus assembly protein N-terminal domain-containing protein [Myxococcota bacterium]
MTSRLAARAWLLVGLAAALDAASASASEQRSILVGTHQRVLLEVGVQRVAVGDPEVLEVQPVTSRELMVLGKAIGRSSLLVWFEDGSFREQLWRVERDLGPLAASLRELHPSIRVESAPHRDALILRGTVPDIRYALAAEQAARAYLRGGGGPVGAAEPADEPADATGTALEQGRELASRFFGGPGDGEQGVINLIRLTTLPPIMEERIRRAIEPVGGSRVTVRRIVRGALPSPYGDTFLLRGKVTNQVTLTRVLITAAQVVTGRSVGSGGIQVLANESGGLGAGGGGGGGSSGLMFNEFQSAAGARTSTAGGGLNNQLSSNVARATALSAANGRLLAFLEVEDLPQVRVDARVYEVDRTRLLTWESDIELEFGDVTDGDNRELGALNLVAGALSGGATIVTDQFSLDASFELLETNDIARVLSQPGATVLSGETAQFQVGGQVPITVSVSTGATGTADALLNSTVFEEFGVRLGVRPLVGPGDVVTLDVLPDLSRPDFDLTSALRDSTGETQSSTAFETRSLRTSARLRDGQSLLLAGLITQTDVDGSDFTPWLHRVPLLGWLAKTVDRQATVLEIVIVVTPTIVREPSARVALWAFPDTVGALVAEAAEGTNPALAAQNK